MTGSWRDVPVPERLAARPTDDRGYPVTFVAFIGEDGTPDFTTVDEQRLLQCVELNLCGLCGTPLGRFRAFIGGPNCAKMGQYLDPWMHRDCAEYAWQVCPYLATPTARYRKTTEDDHVVPFVSGERPEQMYLVVASRVEIRLTQDAQGVTYIIFAPDMATAEVVDGEGAGVGKTG